MKIIRKKLTPDEIAPSNLRYDATCNCVQQTYDGGATWVDQPGADPRSADVFRYPARTGSTKQCDAAANMVANIESQIFNSTNAISSTGNAIAGVTILLQFLDLLGDWGVLAALLVDFCNLIVSIGVTGVQAAFTTTVYSDLECILYCDIGSDGSVNAGQLAHIQSDVASHFGALSDVNIVLQGILGYMGAVGLSNAGATGTAVGSCGGCSSCVWRHYWLDGTDLADWFSPTSLLGRVNGAYTGSVVRGTTINDQLQVWGSAELNDALHITKIKMFFNFVNTGGMGSNVSSKNIFVNATRVFATYTGGSGSATYEWTGSSDVTSVGVLIAAQVSASITRIELEGTGTAPSTGTPF